MTGSGDRDRFRRQARTRMTSSESTVTGRVRYMVCGTLQSGRAVRRMLQATAPAVIRGPFRFRALSLNRPEKHPANLPLTGCLEKGAKWLSFFPPTLCVRVRRRRGWSASYGLLVMVQLPSEFFWTVISLPKASSLSKPSGLHIRRLPIVRPNLCTGPPSRQIELSLCTDKITLAKGDEPPVYRHPSPSCISNPARQPPMIEALCGAGVGVAGAVDVNHVPAVSRCVMTRSAPRFS